jgi:hypothetical protein
MHRLILVVVVSVLAPLSSERALAQGVSLGVVGGVNIASQSTDVEDADLDSRLGLVAGAHLSINFSPTAGLMLEALYSEKGHGPDAFRKHTYVEFPILVEFMIPASEAGKVLVHVAAGPAVGIEVSCKITGIQTTRSTAMLPELPPWVPQPPVPPPPPIVRPHFIESFKSYSSPEEGAASELVDCDEIGVDSKRVDFGLMALGGLDIQVGPGAVVLDVGYTLGLTDVDDTYDDWFLKNRTLFFRAGYKFFLGSD